MIRMQWIAFVLLASSVPFAQAEEVGPIQPDAKTMAYWNLYDQILSSTFGNQGEELEQEAHRPFAEYERAAHLLMSTGTAWGTADLKLGIAANLPENTELTLLATSAAEVPRAEKAYAEVLDPDRFTVLHVPGRSSGAFWFRDSSPVPVFLDGEGTSALVDARNWHYYEPDEALAKHFSVPLLEHSHRFEGGNFMADAQGNCFVIANSTSTIPDEKFRAYYGCQRVTRLPRMIGIGHVDEVVKVISDKVIMTDVPAYQETFEGLGYEVVMMPKPVPTFEGYINATVVNGTVYLPTFGHSMDEEAAEIYESFGLNVVPLRSNSLIQGSGSIHCITMTYPPGASRAE